MFLLLQKNHLQRYEKKTIRHPLAPPNRQLPSLWGDGWLVNALFGKAVHYVFQKKGAKVSIHHAYHPSKLPYTSLPVGHFF